MLDVSKASSALADELPPPPCRSAATDLDVCVEAFRSRALLEYEHASFDQRRVFLLHGRDRFDYRGIPCRKSSTGRVGATREIWSYCDRNGRDDRVYSFADGKLKSVYDPRADHIIPS